MRSLGFATFEQPLALVPSLRFRVTYLDRVSALLLVVLVIADISLGKIVKLSGPEHLLDPRPWVRLGLMYLLVTYCSCRPLPRLVDAARLAMWSGMLLTPITYLFQIAGRSHFPLVDPQLAAIDRQLHFSTAAVTNAVTDIPFLAGCLMVSYCMFGPVVVGSMLIPSVCGFGKASRRFFLAMLLALLLAAVISVFVPAAGPWTTEVIQPSRQQAAVALYLHRLKSAMPVATEIDHSGIVSFPSIHVAFAILAAQALGTVKQIRIPAWLLCSLICISTVATGWHYGIDVLGGAAVALIASMMAKRLCSVLDRCDQFGFRAVRNAAPARGDARITYLG